MFFSTKKADNSNKTSNNVIVPMDRDRMRRISSMSVEEAQKTYDRIIQSSGQSAQQIKA